MSAPIKILATAIGGDLSQSIVKALRLSELHLEIHGCDLAPTSHGEAFVERYHKVPPASDPGYAARLDELCREFGFEAVIPAAEAEMLALIGHSLPRGCVTVSQPGEWLVVFADKLSAMRALAGRVELGLFADGGDAGDVAAMVRSCGYPVVVKPRRSSGSRRVRVAQSAPELADALTAVPDAVVQEFADESGGEFSAGVFRCPAFETAAVFRRTLGATVGLSWQAELVQDSGLRDYALRVARASGAQGSINVQFRLTRKGPRLLEINPRFSSLVAARAACGFRDAEWALALALRRPPTPPREPYTSLRFRRFYHEMIDLGQGFGIVPQWQPRPVPAAQGGDTRER